MSQASTPHQIQVRHEQDAQEMPPVMQFGTLVIGVPFLLTAIRCTLQYIVVPLLLPLLGVSNTFSPLINVGAGVLSIGVILFNVGSLWHTSWRKRYLLIAAIVIPIILVMMRGDYQAYLDLVR
ncbi:MAG: hypothetical protein KIT46_01180 [Anaerolineales bacterium]|nr:hypothetical protein [Anaerolineales bacterium]MCW5854635.1 hypothetical protein [Anaerolineales bacterium]